MLKQNNDFLVNIIKGFLQKVNLEKNKKDDLYKQEIYSHDIFMAITEILKQLDKITFEQSKELIGKSLREDFSEMNKSSTSNSTAQGVLIHILTNLFIGH